MRKLGQNKMGLLFNAKISHLCEISHCVRIVRNFALRKFRSSLRKFAPQCETHPATSASNLEHHLHQNFSTDLQK